MKSAIPSAAAVLVAGGLAVAAARSSGPHAKSSPSSPPTFTPEGCSFAVAARPEYREFGRGAPVTAPSPHIRRVRLGLGGNVAVGAPGRADPSTTIAFAWETDDGTAASEVTWGKGPDPAAWPPENRAQGITWITPPGMIGGLPAARMHEAYLCGLDPATTYHYRVGGGPPGKEVWSDVYRFTTTPSGPDRAVKIGITGDSRGERGDAWRLAQRRMREAAIDLQLFSGDAISSPEDQREWEQWLDAAWRDDDAVPPQPLTLPEILMLTAHGNHDNHTSLYFGNVALPQDQARYPRYAELFFSVDVGPAHIVVVDDAWIAKPAEDPAYAGALAEWLHADLAEAVKNRARVPWIIAVQHRSEFSSSSHGRDASTTAVRKYFVPIWDAYHVDLAVRGHDHDYERTKPLTGPADRPTIHESPADGTVYLVCAGVGAPGYPAGKSDFTALSHAFDQGEALGNYAILTVDRATLKLEAHDLLPDATDPVFDRLTITK